MTKRVIQIGAGSYSQTEYQGGLLGGAEYARANMESDLVRSGSRQFSSSVRRGETMFSESNPAPPKPAAIALSGYDMFGPESLGSTTRNMILDMRGEVVSTAQASKAVSPPTGGGFASQTGNVVEKPLASTMRASSRKMSSGRSQYNIGRTINYRGGETQKMEASAGGGRMMSRQEMYPSVLRISAKSRMAAAPKMVSKWFAGVRFPWSKRT